jgi:hypothetical protein
MINNINHERRRSMDATPTRPSSKGKLQGTQKDPKQKQDRAQGRARSGLSYEEIKVTDKQIKIIENK